MMDNLTAFKIKSDFSIVLPDSAFLLLSPFIVSFPLCSFLGHLCSAFALTVDDVAPSETKKLPRGLRHRAQVVVPADRDEQRTTLSPLHSFGRYFRGQARPRPKACSHLASVRLITAPCL